jgi:hypothetical protein
MYNFEVWFCVTFQRFVKSVTAGQEVLGLQNGQYLKSTCCKVHIADLVRG